MEANPPALPPRCPERHDQRRRGPVPAHVDATQRGRIIHTPTLVGADAARIRGTGGRWRNLLVVRAHAGDGGTRNVSADPRLQHNH